MTSLAILTAVYIIFVWNIIVSVCLLL